jgi:hypothetical protein
MATIKEFKKWLDRFPEETIIEVGFQQRAGNYESYGAVEFETIKLEDSDSGFGWEFADFRTNQFVMPEDEMFGKCILSLGDSV